MENKRNIKNFILFLVKLCCLLCLIFLASKLLFWYLWEYEDGINAYDNAYQHALLNQYNQISDSDRANEIIFFGSSTCAFGIDVKAVEETTGMQAQIFAIETAVAPNFLCSVLKETAKSGDTICYIFDKDTGVNEDFVTVCCAFEDNKEFLKKYWQQNSYGYNLYKMTLCWRKLYALTAGGIVENIRKNISSKDQVYTLSSFDENGNMSLVRDCCMIDQNIGSTIDLNFDNINPELITTLNDFNSWCQENDVNFVIAYNMLPEGSFINDEESIKNYHESLCKALDAPVITRPEDGLLAADMFYNSAYHLNSKGAREYSIRVASNIFSKSDKEY